ncbi:hypothetical protein [Verminephrobacter aporrectodeae]|nr:hypothetical protein [Verminephrobacter aporrectodeae]
MLREMPTFHQDTEMLLERVALAVSQPDRIAHGDAPMLAREFDDL